MDKLDMQILRLLNDNARLSFREIARKAHVSIATVANRIRRLESEGIISGYAPRLDAEKLGYDIVALISLRICHGKLMSVQEKIASDARIYGVYDITGDWDSLVIGRFKTRAELNKFLKSLLATEHIERTSTSMALNVIKQEPRILV